MSRRIHGEYPVLIISFLVVLFMPVSGPVSPSGDGTPSGENSPRVIVVGGISGDAFAGAGGGRVCMRETK